MAAQMNTDAIMKCTPFFDLIIVSVLNSSKTSVQFDLFPIFFPPSLLIVTQLLCIKRTLFLTVALINTDTNSVQTKHNDHKCNPLPCGSVSLKHSKSIKTEALVNAYQAHKTA